MADDDDSQEVALKALQLDLEFRNRELAANTAARAAQLAFDQKRMQLIEAGQLQQQADQFAKTYALEVAELTYQRDLAYRQFGVTEQTTRFSQELERRKTAYDEQFRAAEMTGFLNGVPTLEREQFGEQIRQFNVNAILNAPRGPADYAAYMNRMRGLVGNGLMAGAMPAIFGGPGADITTGGAVNYGMPTPASNTDLAAVMTASGAPWANTGQIGGFNLPGMPAAYGAPAAPAPSTSTTTPKAPQPKYVMLTDALRREGPERERNGYFLYGGEGADGWYDSQGRLVKPGPSGTPPPEPGTPPIGSLSSSQQAAAIAIPNYNYVSPVGGTTQQAALSASPPAISSTQQAPSGTGSGGVSSWTGGGATDPYGSAYGDTSQAAVQRMFSTGLQPQDTGAVKYGQDVSYQQFRRLSPTEQQFATGLVEEYGGQPREDFVSQMLSAAPQYQRSAQTRFGF